MDTACYQPNWERNGRPPAAICLRAGKRSAWRCGNVATRDGAADFCRANAAHREKSSRNPFENIVFPRDRMIFCSGCIVFPCDRMIFRNEDIVFPRDRMIVRGEDIVFRGDVMVFRGENIVFPRKASAFSDESMVFPRDGMVFSRDVTILRGENRVFPREASVFSDESIVFRDESSAAFRASAVLRDARGWISLRHRAHRVDPRDRAGMNRRGTTHGARAHAKNPAPGVRSAVFG